VKRGKRGRKEKAPLLPPAKTGGEKKKEQKSLIDGEKGKKKKGPKSPPYMAWQRRGKRDRILCCRRKERSPCLSQGEGGREKRPALPGQRKNLYLKGEGAYHPVYAGKEKERRGWGDLHGRGQVQKEKRKRELKKFLHFTSREGRKKKTPQSKEGKGRLSEERILPFLPTIPSFFRVRREEKRGKRSHIIHLSSLPEKEGGEGGK